MNCDWQHMLEDGGIGGVIMAVVWGLWTFFKSRGAASVKKGQYEK